MGADPRWRKLVLPRIARISRMEIRTMNQTRVDPRIARIDTNADRDPKSGFVLIRAIRGQNDLSSFHLISAYPCASVVQKTIGPGFGVPAAFGRFCASCRRGTDSHSTLRSAWFPVMKATFTYWKESDGKYLGYLNSHPRPLDAGRGFGGPEGAPARPS